MTINLTWPWISPKRHWIFDVWLQPLVQKTRKVICQSSQLLVGHAQWWHGTLMSFLFMFQHVFIECKFRHFLKIDSTRITQLLLSRHLVNARTYFYQQKPNQQEIIQIQVTYWRRGVDVLLKKTNWVILLLLPVFVGSLVPTRNRNK